MKQRQFGAVAALAGTAVMSLFLGVVYYFTVERDAPVLDGWTFRVDFTIDVVQTLALILCALAATRRPLLGVLTAAGLIAAALVLQFFVLHQSLGFSVWSSLLQGVAIGYALAAASKARRLHSKLFAARANH
jgi:hypothetical protein